MKYFYSIIIALCFTTSLCFSSEQIELSSRTGKTISFESREYFGLFPEIKDYTSATLYKDNSSHYFLVNTVKSQVKIPVSDSSIIALRFVIDNFEEIVRDYRIYKLNPNLLTGLIKVYYRYNRNSEPIKLVMKDKSEISGYVLCMDTSHIVIITDTVYIPSSTKFRVVNYKDIYSIPKADYPIIDGSAVIWEENRRSIAEKSLLINTQEKRAIPPEAVRYIAENPRKENNTFEESKLDFDDLYQKRFAVSVDFSYQRFNISGIQIYSLSPDVERFQEDQMLFSFNNFYSGGVNLDVRVLNNFRVQIGYNFEDIEFTMVKNAFNYSLIGNTYNLNLFYNIWKSKAYNFQQKQLLLDIFLGAQLHRYSYSQVVDFIYNRSDIKYDFEKDNIATKLRRSYKAGLSFRLKTITSSFIYLTGFANYHDNYGYVGLGKALYTRYIHYILSFGCTAGIGFEF